MGKNSDFKSRCLDNPNLVISIISLAILQSYAANASPPSPSSLFYYHGQFFLLGNVNSNLQLVMKLVAKVKIGLQINVSWIDVFFQALATLNVVMASMAGGDDKEPEPKLN